MVETPRNQRIAIYPGSFDPITNGHLDILKRALRIFDKVIIAVLSNSSKKALFSLDERTEMIEESTKGLSVEIEIFDGLLADYTKEKGTNIVIRSMRATSDFDYEFQMASMNQSLNENIETIFLMTGKEHFYLSSSAVKEVARLHGNVDKMVPKPVARRLYEIYNA